MSINKALLKYGYAVFQLEILEYCDPMDVISREQHYLDKLKPEYNILTKAGSSLGYKHSEETLAKLRGRKHTEETLAKFKTRVLSEEARAKIRAWNLGRNLSEDTRKKIGASMGISVKVTDTETGESNIYPSKSQAARELKTNLGTVRNYMIRGKPYMGKYLIEIA
jgi:group I intron endonuclease